MRQHLVAGAVPEAVVDGLEMVDIDHDAGNGNLTGQSGGPLRLEILEEGAAVQTAGERIAGGQDLELLVLSADLGSRLAELQQQRAKASVLSLQNGQVVECGHGAAARPSSPTIGEELTERMRCC